MRYGKQMIAVLTVILTGLLLLTGPREYAEEESVFPLSFSIFSENQTEEIRCWMSPKGEYYVFLPSYAALDQIRVLTGSADVRIGDFFVEDGALCTDYLLNTSYPLRVIHEEGHIESNITFLHSGGIPTLYLNVQSGSMDYIHLDKTHEEPGDIRMYSSSGKKLYAGKLESVKGRGNTSWGADKRPYNITLSQEADLLGMGAAQRWILLAEGYNTLNIRNKIVYDFADAVGMAYSPECQWVDLYLNGEYAGLYLLTERIEINEHRTNLTDKDAFIVSLEVRENLDNQKIPYVLAASGQALRIRDSKADVEKLTSVLQSAESAILSDDGRDPATGKHWTQLIDVDSWAMKYLIEEFFANPDGGAVSQFFYFEGAAGENKLYAGPVWDYDFAIGGENAWMGNCRAYYTMAREYTQDGIYMPWFYELYRKPEFYNRVITLYEQKVLPQIEELLVNRLDEYGALIVQSARMDQIRWDLPADAAESEISFLKSFLQDREEFFTDLWINNNQYYTVSVYPGRYYTAYYAVREGDILPALPSYEEIGGLGWYNAETDEPFDITQPIYEDAQIYVKKPETSIPKIHYVPLAALVILLPILLLADRKRTRMNGRPKHESAKIN